MPAPEETVVRDRDKLQAMLSVRVVLLTLRLAEVRRDS
jgi:hypothetical protein